MHVVLWDTRKLEVSKDFAGGFGVGQFPGRGGFRDRVIRRFYRRDRRPVALLFAHLAAIFRQLGHRCEYVVDRDHRGADLYVFCPSLITLQLERQAIDRVLRLNPKARVLVVGLVASVMPEAFDNLEVTVVKGEAEQLLWRLDEVWEHPGATVQLGVIEDLDALPLPDWSPFVPQKFRIGYDFSRFPTALIQASRGCSFKCNYCPYIVLDNGVRVRDPNSVVEEIRHGVAQWGFRSFKFRDPLFGWNQELAFRLAERIGRLPKKIQFSVESRIDLMRPELLRVLRQVGLTSITVGIETPDDDTLRRYRRAPVKDDHQHEFLHTCRKLGIRTVAGFLIGFPDDTEQSIRAVLRYAIALNPTFANFNLVTPYPGTEFFREIRPQIASLDFSRYTVYSPVMKYTHLTADQVAMLHSKCFRRFFFRWQYLRDNAHVLWPILRRLGIGQQRRRTFDGPPAHAAVPKPLYSSEVLRRQGLRQDGPHRHPGVSDQTGDRHAAD